MTPRLPGNWWGTFTASDLGLAVITIAGSIKLFRFYWWLSSEEKSWLGAACIYLRSLGTTAVGFGLLLLIYGRLGLLLFAGSESVLLTALYIYVEANGYLPDVRGARISFGDLTETVRPGLRRAFGGAIKCGWDAILVVLYCLMVRLPCEPAAEWLLGGGCAVWLSVVLFFSLRNRGREALWRLPRRAERAVYLYGCFAAQFAWWLEIGPDPSRIKPLAVHPPARDPFPPGAKTVVAIQLESIGSAIVDRMGLFRELNRFILDEGGFALGRCAMFRCGGGTADSEYTVLTGRRPLGGDPFQHSVEGPIKANLIATCLRSGYRTFAAHGNSGLFYDRARWYRELGFERLCFRDSFASRPGRWGIEDDDLLGEMGHMLERERGRGPLLLVNVLMSTHYPYNLFSRRKIARQDYPGKLSLPDRYQASCQYLEKHLIEFVRRLQSVGDYLCILYGDHPPGVALERVSGGGGKAGMGYVPVWAISDRRRFTAAGDAGNATLMDVGATLNDVCGGGQHLGEGTSLLLQEDAV